MIGPYYVTTEAKRLAAWGDPGTADRGGDVKLKDLLIVDRILGVNELGYEAFAAYAEIAKAHGYKAPGTDTGFYSFRHMRHDPNLPWSVHAWAMALDLNWLQNPAGNKLVTDIPRAMRDDLLALRTVSGARVFLWGADWDWDGLTTDHTYVDAMHWECVAHPLDLATGIKGFTVAPKPPPTTKDWTKELIMALPTLKEGDGYKTHPQWKKDVQRMQACCAIGGVMATNTFSPKTGMPDGKFGPGTKNALVTFQKKNGLSSDGVCGKKTWTKLLGE